MNSFKTPKGTELPFIDLKGKQYLQVMHRLVWFREQHPDWSIKTIPYQLTETYCIFAAEISNNEGKLVQTGHGREDAKHFPDFIEKAETKAIGRALAACGFGTQFAPELDEGERIVDSPRPATHVTFGHTPPAAKATSPKDYVITFGQFNGKRLVDINYDSAERYANYLKDGAKKMGKPLSGPAKDFITHFEALKPQEDPPPLGDEQLPF